jgi:hypothetical protein
MQLQFRTLDEKQSLQLLSVGGPGGIAKSAKKNH